MDLRIWLEKKKYAHLEDNDRHYFGKPLENEVPEVIQALLLYVTLWSPTVRRILPGTPYTKLLMYELRNHIATDNFLWQKILFKEGMPSHKVYPEVALETVKNYLSELPLCRVVPTRGWHALGHRLSENHWQPYLAVMPYDFMTTVQTFLEELSIARSILLEQIIFLIRVIATDQKGNLNIDDLFEVAKFWAPVMTLKPSLLDCTLCATKSKKVSSEGMARVLFTLARWDIRVRKNPFLQVFQRYHPILTLGIDFDSTGLSLKDF